MPIKVIPFSYKLKIIYILVLILIAITMVRYCISILIKIDRVEAFLFYFIIAIIYHGIRTHGVA